MILWIPLIAANLLIYYLVNIFGWSALRPNHWLGWLIMADCALAEILMLFSAILETIRFFKQKAANGERC